MRKGCIAILVILLAGCGDSGEDSAPSFSSSADIQAALNKAGLVCTGYEPVAKEDRDWGATSAADVGKCDIENETIKMVIWKDEGQKENWVGLAKKVGCALGGSFLGVSSFDFVDGGLWTVSEMTQTLAKKISDAIGGKAIHVDCPDVTTPPA
jgi:hypothetical protein